MRTSPLSLLAAAVVASAALPSSSSAQTPADAFPADAARGGVHFSIGLGPGSASASCPGCGSDFFEDRLTGVSGVAQLGFFANPRLAVVGEFVGWLRNDAPIHRRVAGLGVGILGYPSANSGFFVKGSVGGIRAIAEDDALTIQTDAWMATTGIGYDLPVGESVSLTLYANYVRGFGGATWANGVSSPVVVTPNAVQVGVGFTVH